jgi:hypothetical protein
MEWWLKWPLFIILTALAFWSAAWLYRHVPAEVKAVPRVRDTSVAAATASTTPRRLQEEWEPVLLPPTGSQWLKVPTLPGRTIQYCRTDTDPNCTDTEPKGFRVQCKDSSGEVRTWPNTCVIGDWIAWQSDSGERVPLKWRDKPQ